jgi:hypothetical protein
METPKFRVHNRSRESFLSLEVAVVDTTVEPLKKLVEDLAVQADFALWLKPYRGIPAAPGLPRFDLMYLDEFHRVVQEVESFPSPEARPLHPRTASALALPAHTIFASQAKPGDELDFREMDEAEVMQRERDRAGESKESVAGASTDNHGGAPTENRAGRLQFAAQKLDASEAEYLAKQKVSLKARFLRWLNSEPSDRRVGIRHPLPGLVAYHWTGGAPKAYHVGNISDTGFYLLTEERPFPGTIVLMTLQRTETSGENPEDSIAVRSKVVHWGSDGVGLEFVLAVPVDSRHRGPRPENGADHAALEKFLKSLDLSKHKSD